MAPSNRNLKRSTPRPRGYTLVEVLVASSILAMGVSWVSRQARSMLQSVVFVSCIIVTES